MGRINRRGTVKAFPWRARSDMNSTSKFNKVFNFITNLSATIAGIYLIIVVFCVAAAIIARLAGNPFSWVNEIGGYCLLVIPFLAAAWILRQEQHIVLDMVLNQMRPNTRYVMNSITSLICALVCLVLVWYGIKVSVNLQQMGYFTPTYLELPKFIFIAIISFGCLLFCIQFLIRAYSNWMKRGIRFEKEPLMPKDYGV
jgi:C4-dicarboxylate transporter, DctQ subunit